MKVEALTNYMAKDQAIKKVFVLGQDYAHGQQLAKAVTATLPKKRPDVQIVGKDLHPFGKVKDFSPYVAKIKASGAVWGVGLKIVGDDGSELPHNGKAYGHLHVRGPWIASGYFKGEGGQVLDADGWFPTGDVATIDPDGYVQLVDRAKDVISPAANGFHRSTWKTPPSPIRPWWKRRSSASRIRNGRSGRCCWRSGGRASR